MTVAILGLTLALVHAGAQLAASNGVLVQQDHYVVRVVDEVVPFLNPSDPVGVGAATLSLELFLAAALTVPIRKKLGHARWRGVHALTYAAFYLVTAHVLISGSDVGPVWVWGTVVGAAASTVILWLITTPLIGRARRRLVTRSVERSQAQSLVVDVDAAKCQRFGFCEHEAPEFFRLQGNGRLAYRPQVPAGGAERVVRAVEVCPARAIALRRLPTTVVTGNTGAITTATAGFPATAESELGPRSAAPSDPTGADVPSSPPAGLPVFPVPGGGPSRTSRQMRSAQRRGKVR